jgi:hypothetical protein
MTTNVIGGLVSAISIGKTLRLKPMSRVGKGALFAPCPRGYDDGGHAKPVIGPAESRTRWLCTPYKSDRIDLPLPRHRDLDGVDQGAADEGLEQKGDATGFQRMGARRLVVESGHEDDRNGAAA